MGRIKGSYCIKKKGGYYYYKFPDMKTYLSTGLKKKTESQNFVNDLLKQRNRTIETSNGLYSTKTFKQHTKDFFIWGKCPYFKRRIEQGKNLTKRYCDSCYKILHNKILNTSISSMKMNDIHKKDILYVLEELKETETIGVVNDCISVLSLIFNDCIYWETIEKNPMTGICKFKENKKPRLPYTDEEYMKIFPLDDEEKIIKLWGTFSYFLLDFLECNTGMRNNESRCLQWGDIDFDNDLITISRSFKTEENDIIGPPKNGHSRVVGMCSELRRMLLLQKNKYSSFTEPTDFVCSTKNGIPFRYKSTRRHHVKVMETFGIKNKGHHNYRHTFGTTLRGKGLVSDNDIQTCCGWSSEEILENYSHTDIISSNNIKKGQDKVWKEIRRIQKLVS